MKRQFLKWYTPQEKLPEKYGKYLTRVMYFQNDLEGELELLYFDPKAKIRYNTVYQKGTDLGPVFYYSDPEDGEVEIPTISIIEWTKI